MFFRRALFAGLSSRHQVGEHPAIAACLLSVEHWPKNTTSVDMICLGMQFGFNPRGRASIFDGQYQFLALGALLWHCMVPCVIGFSTSEYGSLGKLPVPPESLEIWHKLYSYLDAHPRWYLGTHKNIWDDVDYISVIISIPHL